MPSQNYHNLGDTDFADQFLSSLLSAAMPVWKESFWLTQFAGLSEALISADKTLRIVELLSTSTPITITPGRCVTFNLKDYKFDMIANGLPRDTNRTAKQETLTVCAGEFSPECRFKCDINWQNPEAALHSAQNLIRRMAIAGIASRDEMIQAVMLGIRGGESVYQMEKKLLDEPGTTLAEKACSPFMEIINDLTKHSNPGQHVQPVSRIFVTDSSSTQREPNDISFYEYKKPPDVDKSIPTPADHAIDALTDKNLLTWSMLREIWVNINYGTHRIEKAKIARQFIEMQENFSTNDKYITIIVNCETMEDLIRDEEGQRKFPCRIEEKTGFQNSRVLIDPSVGLCLMEYDKMPVYKNKEGYRVGVAAILGKDALVVLLNGGSPHGKYPRIRDKDLRKFMETETGVNAIRCGMSRGKQTWGLSYMFGCARSIRKEDVDHPMDCGIMLIHHGMRMPKK